MEHRTPVERTKLIVSRIIIYGVLTLFAFLLLFPLTYMVIASLKTTKDFGSNPRRLIPYSQTSADIDGQDYLLFEFDINTEQQEYYTSLKTAAESNKVSYGFLSTETALQEQLNKGKHVDFRRQPAVETVVPLEYTDLDAKRVKLDGTTLTLIPTEDTISLKNFDNVWTTYYVYHVEADGQPLLNALEANYQSTEAAIDCCTLPAQTLRQVPLMAYSITDSNEPLTLNLSGEVALLDGEGADRDYETYTLGNTSLVMAYNSTLAVFLPRSGDGAPVYSIEANARPQEVVEFQTVNYDLVLGRTENQDLRLDRALVNTAFVTLLVTAGQILTSLFGGYAFSRIPFRGRDTLFMVYLGSIMVPFVVLIVPIHRLMVVLGWNDHLVSLIVPWIFTAYGTFLIRQFFLNIPMELEEAALLDGCSRFRVLWQIFIPLSTPVIATHAIFTFLYAWNSFLWPLVIINTGNKDDHVLTLALITLANINADKPNLVMTGAAVMILPPIIVFILAQRYFIEGIATSGLKG